MPTRKNNRALDVAVAYCHVILNRGINIENDRWLIKQASQLCRAVDELGADDADVLILLAQLHNGTSELTGNVPWNEWAPKRHLGVPVSMWHLLYIRPEGRTDVNLLQAALEIPDIPSVQDAAAYADWVRRYGARAHRAGKWDGVYRYQPFVDVELQAIKPDELRTIVGDRLANVALEEKAALERRLSSAIFQSTSGENTCGSDSPRPDHQHRGDADQSG
jgi:hypothetical protein